MPLEFPLLRKEHRAFNTYPAHAAGGHGGRCTMRRWRSEPLSQFHRVKCQESAVNKEGIFIYYRMGQVFFPLHSLSLIITLPSDGQGG